MNREGVKAQLRAVALKHLPSNARRWSIFMVDEEPPVNAMLGVPTDYRPLEGSVVESFDEAIAVKTDRTSFTCVAKSILPFIPAVGTKVCITPYARRQFDGQRLDAPRVEETTSIAGVRFATRITRIGEYRSPLPVPPPRCEYLADLIKQLEEMSAPDGFRRVSQLLVDANATDFRTVDPAEEDDIMATKPAISFSVRTAKFKGRVSILYFRVPDYYYLVFTLEQGSAEEVEDVDLFSVGRILEERLDDGTWRIAKLHVIRAPKGARKTD